VLALMKHANDVYNHWHELVKGTNLTTKFQIIFFYSFLFFLSIFSIFSAFADLTIRILTRDDFPWSDSRIFRDLNPTGYGSRSWIEQILSSFVSTSLSCNIDLFILLFCQILLFVYKLICLSQQFEILLSIDTSLSIL